MTFRFRPALATAAVLLAAALTACGGDSDTAAPEESPASGASVSHIHGLGIDPADGRLYVATHEGVIAVENDGSSKRVSDTADYMGFTVKGPKTFLGSGHPAAGSGGHANRGLIESTDAGKTWKPLSLGGEVDFHALSHFHRESAGQVAGVSGSWRACAALGRDR
ncbi:beta propeller repeat protein [Streptomyces halobius]|uniref:Exo-alpha-sialidase n=1 Tax=Streptomyces halobius TaxID=2879846 RepID=A0ABY4M2K1_9ACTN|nr:hypothetical protein [Streptomyces halobius]UQA91094.1 hypothetical protein K9S39_03630 [Streptomyces halobius]